LFVALILLTGLYWARAGDPITRTEFSLKAGSGNRFKVMLVRAKPLGSRPTVVWLHGAGGKVGTDGNDLRQFAELGLNAVSFEYDQQNQAEFNNQLMALNTYLARQKWATSNSIAWVGFSQGAQMSLTSVLEGRQTQPRLYVRLAGGWVPELDGLSGAQDTTSQIAKSLSHSAPDSQPLLRCAVLLVHGERDSIFPAQDCRKLASFLRTNGVRVQVRIFAGEQHHFPENRRTLMRGIAEYCANFLGTPQPVPLRTRPALWYYWLPVVLYGVLLTAGRYAQHRAFNSSHLDPYPRLSRILILAACLAGVVGVVVAILHIGLPRLTISPTPLDWTRCWVVRAPMRKDFDWLTKQPFAEGLKISTLLQHLELADLQRKFFYPDLDAEMYRTYVLSPVVEPSSINSPPSTNFHWRRQLWENCYPRIRHETSAASAAQIVVRFLRERVTISPADVEPRGVATIWRQGITDAKGFEFVYVAALRSVGIAARLGSNLQVEFWDGSNWQVAPRPIISSWKDLTQE
jgi:predicted esterase